MMRYRITQMGKDYLDEYQAGGLELYTEWDEERCFYLSSFEDISDPNRIFKLPGKLPKRVSFILKSLLKVGAVEPYRDVMDEADEIAEPFFEEVRKKERREIYERVNKEFRMGKGPPPEFLGIFPDEDDE